MNVIKKYFYEALARLGFWIPCDKYMPDPKWHDWVLISHYEHGLNYRYIPAVAEYSYRTKKWHTVLDDNVEHFLNNMCEVTHWHVIPNDSRLKIKKIEINKTHTTMSKKTSLTRKEKLANVREEFFVACDAYADALKEIWKSEEPSSKFPDEIILFFVQEYNKFGLWYEDYEDEDDREYKAFLTIDELIFIANCESVRLSDVEDWLKTFAALDYSFTEYWKDHTKRLGKEEDIEEFFSTEQN